MKMKPLLALTILLILGGLLGLGKAHADIIDLIGKSQMIPLNYAKCEDKAIEASVSAFRVYDQFIDESQFLFDLRHEYNACLHHKDEALIELRKCRYNTPKPYNKQKLRKPLFQNDTHQSLEINCYEPATEEELIWCVRTCQHRVKNLRDFAACETAEEWMAQRIDACRDYAADLRVAIKQCEKSRGRQ